MASALYLALEGIVWRLLWRPWLHRYQPTGFYKPPKAVIVKQAYQQMNLLEAD